jgi:5-oxoprolinase (ATP-hydrolysing)
MQSNGGLAEAGRFQGKDAILSGPAGGIVGAARTAGMAGLDRIIGFDMGGTSTDVALYAGEFERAFETQVAGVRMRAPMMAINTVAAGGGSILHFDGARFRVGPESAGAVPGPACYRRGGPLTVTDANVMVGKIQPRHFPAIFGPNGDQPLDAEVVRGKIRGAGRGDRGATGTPQDPRAVAEGFLRVAVANMANAIKQVSIQKGHDATRYALQCFGGAGGQHACLVADELGMETVFIHPFAGVLSAYGMGLADQTVIREARWRRRSTPRAMDDLPRARCAGGGRARRAGAPGRRPRASSPRGGCTCATRHRQLPARRPSATHDDVLAGLHRGASPPLRLRHAGAPGGRRGLHRRGDRAGREGGGSRPAAARGGEAARCSTPSSCSATAPRMPRRSSTARRCSPATASPAPR